MRKLKILVLLLLCLNIALQAQDQVLNTTVSLNYRDAKLKDVLLGLERKYNIKFYYANNMIPLNNRVSIHKNNKPLNEVLTEIFSQTEVDFVAVSGKIVLRKSTRSLNRNKKQGMRMAAQNLTAQNTASNSTETIDPSTLQPAFTLSEIKSVPVVNDQTFALTDWNLRDSLLTPMTQSYSKQKNKLLKRYMAKMDSLNKIGDVGSMEDLKVQFAEAMTKLKTKVKAATNSLRNKQLPLFKDNSDTARIVSPLQFTFVTPIGTNGAMSAKTTNKVSFNLLVGYAYALDGVEFGGLVNNEKTTVRGAQFAGISNIVGDDVDGAQFAGILNVSGGMANGAQFAGITNVNGDSASGIQAAGIANVNDGSFLGAQMAGIANVNDGSGSGFQAAGIANVNNGTMRGAQFAGITNIAKDEHTGIQVAGILNRAKRVRGSQIGLINIADTVTGITLGLINIVKNGYNRVEVFSSESMYANASFRYGTRGFHTIFTVGARPSSTWEDNWWSYGLGFGTTMALAPRVDLGLDLVSSHVNEGYEKYTDRMNLLNQFKTHLNIQLAHHLSLFAGPTINVMLSQYKAETNRNKSLVPNTLFDETYENKRDGEDRDDVNVKIWLGFNAGLRF